MVSYTHGLTFQKPWTLTSKKSTQRFLVPENENESGRARNSALKGHGKNPQLAGSSTNEFTKKITQHGLHTDYTQRFKYSHGLNSQIHGNN